MRILAVVTGIALMLTGIWAFWQRGAVFLSIAFVLGCVMVFTGLASILVYFFAPGKQDGFGWFFAEGFVTLILGCIVLANQLATDAMVLPFFGMWVLFCGVMRIVSSLHLVMVKNNSWIVNLFLGLLSTVVGVYAFFNQIAAGLPLILLTGVFFMMQGVNVLAYGIFIPGKKKVKRHGGTKRV
ncbi:MAG: DUF308 domain-containing protein [Clostridiales bacterium]|nr:DUF308 domain-containing protein [Clostridiales bacterium]